MKMLNKDAYWWKGQEKEWAMQDRSGNWWIYKNKKKDNNEMMFKRRSKEGSAIFSKEYYIIIALASALGISLALNVIAILV
tara:strand:- start:8096 stop:8338 length:243 start_codon:yes stop_codon:yes gene_type:complete